MGDTLDTELNDTNPNPGGYGGFDGGPLGGGNELFGPNAIRNQRNNNKPPLVPPNARFDPYGPGEPNPDHFKPPGQQRLSSADKQLEYDATSKNNKNNKKRKFEKLDLSPGSNFFSQRKEKYESKSNKNNNCNQPPNKSRKLNNSADASAKRRYDWNNTENDAAIAQLFYEEELEKLKINTKRAQNDNNTNTTHNIGAFCQNEAGDMEVNSGAVVNIPANGKPVNFGAHLSNKDGNMGVNKNARFNAAANEKNHRKEGQ